LADLLTGLPEAKLRLAEAVAGAVAVSLNERSLKAAVAEEASREKFAAKEDRDNSLPS